MSGDISIPDDVNTLIADLKAGGEELMSVSGKLDSISSESQAMKEFRSRSKESKAAFHKYRNLYMKDIAAIAKAVSAIEGTDKELGSSIGGTCPVNSNPVNNNHQWHQDVTKDKPYQESAERFRS